MNIKQINQNEFEKFANDCEYHNFHQTMNYALLKAEEGYDYEIIGYFQDGEIKAASLVIIGKIGGKLYGYVPEGFLIDYSNKVLLADFTKELKKYYRKKNFSFIKVNPRVIIGTLNKKTGKVIENKMEFIPRFLINQGYTKLKDNLYFESRLPRFGAIINLNSYNENDLVKNTRNKIRKAIRKGIVIQKGQYNDINYLNEFLQKDDPDNKFHYLDYYSIFQKSNMIDCFVAKIDYKAFLENAQKGYDKEIYNNKVLSQKMLDNPSVRNVNNKMNSDSVLEAYHSDILKANKMVNVPDKVIAVALVIKYKETVSLLINAYDKNYSDFSANYLLFDTIINLYKDNYKYFDFNGIVGDFKDNPYSGLNRFKIGFNPNLYQYAGEYDLILSTMDYDALNRKGLLAKEFNK